MDGPLTGVVKFVDKCTTMSNSTMAEFNTRKKLFAETIKSPLPWSPIRLAHEHAQAALDSGTPKEVIRLAAMMILKE